MTRTWLKLTEQLPLARLASHQQVPHHGVNYNITKCRPENPGLSQRGLNRDSSFELAIETCRNCGFWDSREVPGERPCFRGLGLYALSHALLPWVSTRWLCLFFSIRVVKDYAILLGFF